MGGPRILVFHIRQLLRTGAFVLAGLIIIILLVWVLAPKNKADDASLTVDENTSLYVPGDYNSYIVLDNQPLKVTVTVDGDRITGINLGSITKAQEALYPLIKPTMETLSKDIIQYQSTNVEYPNGSQFTSQILLEAINLALNQAYADVIVTGYN